MVIYTHIFTPKFFNDYFKRYFHIFWNSFFFFSFKFMFILIWNKQMSCEPKSPLQVWAHSV